MNLGLLGYTYKFFEHYLTNYADGIKSVDLFFNQFESQATGATDGRANPRVLVLINEFEPLELTRIGGVQNWVGTVTLFIGIDIINSFYSGSELQENNLQYLNLLDQIYIQLSGISSYNLPDELKEDAYRIYQVERSRVALAVNEGPIKVSQIDFTFIVEDNSIGKFPTIDEVTTIDIIVGVPVA